MGADGKERVMLTRKCDICGAEMRMTTPRFKVTFDGWLYTEEVDICMDCFNRIAREIKQADTPQTDSEKPNNCEHITEDGVTCAKYPACDDCLDNPLNKVKGSERLEKGSEQTDCDRYVVDEAGEKHYGCMGCQTDCPWE